MDNPFFAVNYVTMKWVKSLSSAIDRDFFFLLKIGTTILQPLPPDLPYK